MPTEITALLLTAGGLGSVFVFLALLTLFLWLLRYLPAEGDGEQPTERYEESDASEALRAAVAAWVWNRHREEAP